MRLSASSYIGERRARQSSCLARPVLFAAIATWLGGCTGLGLPFGDTAVDRSLTTGSVQKVSGKSAGKVDPSDWEAVRETIARAAGDGPEKSLNWRNPKTGTTGTVTVLNTITATNDPNCRNFQTTLNDTRGIRHYRGEACRTASKDWRLFGVLADDSKLL